MKRMIDLRSFEVPTVVKHAPGCIACLADEVRALGGKRPMLVTDKGLVAAGLVDEAVKSLRTAGMDYVLFDDVVPNPGIELVDGAAVLYLEEGCDSLIGLGGGSSMDTAKSIGVVAVNGGSILDYEWADPQPIKNRIPPLVCVPTTAGTGSEVTLWAVITDPARKIKYNVGGTGLIAAHVALIDPRLTLGLPPRITAGTGMDALTHAIECFTCAYAQPWPDAVALWAIETIAQWLRGELTASLLAPVMTYNYMGEPHKYARIAQAMGENTWGLSVWDAAELAAEAVARLSSDLGIPTLPELGIPEEDIPMLAQLAYDDPQTIGNPRDIDAAGYEAIYRSCFG
jgi:choline dehydrogenase